jgi:DNA-directed RNA polymerase subunit RPC12/RpoP
MNYQRLEYSCPECGMLLKETVGELNQDLKESVEECPKCGSILTLKEVWRPSQTQELYHKESNRRSLATLSQVPSLSKFQIAYEEFISRWC